MRILGLVAIVVLAGCSEPTETVQDIAVEETVMGINETHPYTATAGGQEVCAQVICFYMNDSDPEPVQPPSGGNITSVVLDVTVADPLEPDATASITLRCELEGRSCAQDIIAQDEGVPPLHLEAHDLDLPADAVIVIDWSWDRTVPSGSTVEDRLDLHGTYTTYTPNGTVDDDGPSRYG